MRDDLKEKLDSEHRKERLRSYAIGGCVAGGFLLFILIFLPLFPKSSTNIEGIAVHLGAVQTDEGSRPIMLVKLENGEKVKASMQKVLPFRKGAKIKLVMNESITGLRSYQAIGYSVTNQNDENY